MTAAPRDSYLTSQDHDDLLSAENLIRGVIMRHGPVITLPTIATLDQAILGLRVAERRMLGGW